MPDFNAHRADAFLECGYNGSVEGEFFAIVSGKAVDSWGFYVTSQGGDTTNAGNKKDPFFGLKQARAVSGGTNAGG